MAIWHCPLDMFQEPSLLIPARGHHHLAPSVSSLAPYNKPPCCKQKQGGGFYDLRDTDREERAHREIKRELLIVNPAASMERVASSCVSLLAQRRAYSAAAAMAKGAGRRVDDKKAAAAKRVMGKKEADGKTAWVPDPVTGYYRPAGGAKEVDAAELRAKLLTQATN